MRLSITHKLFLVILSACMLVLITMHIGVQISFERGFIDYIKHDNEQRITKLAKALENRYAEQQNWDFLRSSGRVIFKILRDIEHSSSMEQDLPPPGWRTPFWVTDNNMHKLVGPARKLPHNGLHYPLYYHHQVVGWIITTPPERLTRNADINFARQQRRTSWLIMALTTLLAAIITLLLSRSMLAPVKRLIHAMHQLAAGEFSTRVPVNRRDELGKLGQDFNQLAITLEKNEHIRRATMADVSHELRTPLAILRGELEALQDGVRPLTPQSLVSLQTEVGTLTKLVDDLHHLSLSDAGALAYRKHQIDLAPLLQLAHAVFQQRFQQKGIRLSLDIPKHIPLFGDPDRLQQLFHNLLENSLRYTDSQGHLQIIARQRNKQLQIDWQDSAPGVSDEQLALIFDRFYRAENSRNRASGGSGLGLPICQNIVEAHGGTISASHSPLGGVTLRVLLPVLQN